MENQWNYKLEIVFDCHRSLFFVHSLSLSLSLHRYTDTKSDCKIPANFPWFLSLLFIVACSLHRTVAYFPKCYIDDKSHGAERFSHLLLENIIRAWCFTSSTHWKCFSGNVQMNTVQMRSIGPRCHFRLFVIIEHFNEDDFFFVRSLCNSMITDSMVQYFSYFLFVRWNAGFCTTFIEKSKFLG